MFCSKCKEVNTDLFELKRRICVQGHILCEGCDNSLISECILCFDEISSFVEISNKNKIPSLLITKKLDSSALSYSDLGSRQIDLINEHLNEYRNQLESSPGSISRKTNASTQSTFISNKNQRGDQISYHMNPKSSTPISSVNSSPLSGEYEKDDIIKYFTAKHEVQTVSDISKTGDYNYSQFLEKQTSSLEIDFGSENDQSASILQYFKNGDSTDSSNTAPISSPSTPGSPENAAKQILEQMFFSVACRSKFSSKPITDVLPNHIEPVSQYLTGKSTLMDSLLVTSRNIPRGPILCPISMCGAVTVQSDFCNHISIDHPYILFKTLQANQVINFQVNFKSEKVDFAKCQLVFLVSDKIKDLGYGTYANHLPIMLMSSRVRPTKSFPSNKVSDGACDLFLLWLISVYQFPITCSLTVWSHQNEMTPGVIKTLTNDIGSIGKNFNCMELHTKGNALVLSQAEVKVLTNDGRKSLNCQIMFY